MTRWGSGGILGLATGCRAVLAPDVAPPADAPDAAWEAVLAEVVTDDGSVDYDRLAERRGPLDRYVAWLGTGSPPRDRDNPQHAFWLNAYNALVLWTVLHDGLHERGAAAREADGGVFSVDGWLPFDGSAFFVERAYRVQGMPTSLWEIEHERLRGRVMDYRDHAALNCATRSCPPLRGELYRLRDLDAQLDDQMGRWVDDDRGLTFDGDTVVFSPIFQRYAWDFSFLTVGDDLCTTAARYASGVRKERLRAAARAGCPHRFAPWDRRLNEASPGGTAGPG